MESEVAKFDKIGSTWWDPNGPMKMLHSMNQARVPFIKKAILESQSSKSEMKTAFPLSGYTVLDIGCGGGFLSEGLGKLGASVVGIDPGEENVKVADAHLTPELRENVSYQSITIQDFVKDNPEKLFDAVVISEVIEHVDHPHEFLETAIRALKDGGSIILTTPNRTFLSWFGVILLSEYILRNLPIGTHSYDKFITPKELKKILEKIGNQVHKVRGLFFNPLTKRWSRNKLTSIVYAIHAVKDSGSKTE